MARGCSGGRSRDAGLGEGRGARRAQSGGVTGQVLHPSRPRPKSQAMPCALGSPPRAPAGPLAAAQGRITWARRGRCPRPQRRGNLDRGGVLWVQRHHHHRKGPEVPGQTIRPGDRPSAGALHVGRRPDAGGPLGVVGSAIAPRGSKASGTSSGGLLGYAKSNRPAEPARGLSPRLGTLPPVMPRGQSSWGAPERRETLQALKEKEDARRRPSSGAQRPTHSGASGRGSSRLSTIPGSSWSRLRARALPRALHGGARAGSACSRAPSWRGQPQGADGRLGRGREWRLVRALVVAAVRMDPEQAAELAEFNLKAVKDLSDTGPCDSLPSSASADVLRIDPPEYNKRFPDFPGSMVPDFLHAGPSRSRRRGTRCWSISSCAATPSRMPSLTPTSASTSTTSRTSAMATRVHPANAEYRAIMELSERYDIELHKGRACDRRCGRAVPRAPRRGAPRAGRQAGQNTDKVRAA